MSTAVFDGAAPIWTPTPARIAAANLTAYMNWLAARRGLKFGDYAALWNWSVDDAEAFWDSIREYFDIRSSTPWTRVLAQGGMPGAKWFPDARVNYVDQVFRHATTARPAIVFDDEAGGAQEISWQELERRVASLAAALRGLGVIPGDRVVAYLPNRPEAIVAFLACASIGAIWSICSLDMGPVSVLDRFRQIEPKVLIASDAYRYGGKLYQRADTLAEIRQALPTLEHVVLVAHAQGQGASLAGVLRWEDLVASKDVTLVTDDLPFEHPLWIVYSSGTTGIPKAIVQGHGGIMMMLLITLAFHNDLGANDRFHWYSSTGWIMWNAQVSGLLVGSTVCIFDGNPGYPDLGALWSFVGRAECTFMGAGAAYFASCLKAGIEPGKVADLSRLRTVGSTGSPLSAECYRWIYEHIGNGDIWLTPMSGGTDLAGPFIAGAPILPVYTGEMQCRVLGAAVYAFDESGKSVVDEVGELVCTQPIPSMPLYFWNDPQGRRYFDSYFDTYPGVWRHGDWIRITPRGGAVIYGRSDATINRHGIRMGTSELYRAVEALPDILDSMVVDLEYLGKPSYMPLFVVLRPGATLDAGLRDEINRRIREALTPRHVPNDIFVVPAIPRTMSGKKLELPIKKLLLGQDLDKIVNRDSMANPESLQCYVEFARQRALAAVNVNTQ